MSNLSDRIRSAAADLEVYAELVQELENMPKAQSFVRAEVLGILHEILMGARQQDAGDHATMAVIRFKLALLRRVQELQDA